MTLLESPVGVSRRTLAKGAAWSLPAIAASAAVPVVAASCSSPSYTMQGTVSTYFSGTNMTAPGSGVTLIAGGGTTASTGICSGISGIANNYFYTNATAAEVNLGGVGLGSSATWLMLNQGCASSTNGYNQTVNLNFSQTVYCVSFYVADLDGSVGYGSYKDKVRVPGFTASLVDPATTHITVSGDTATVNAYVSTSASSARGTVKFTYTGAGITSLSVVYSNAAAPATAQYVLISPITFKTQACC